MATRELARLYRDNGAVDKAAECYYHHLLLTGGGALVTAVQKVILGVCSCMCVATSVCMWVHVHLVCSYVCACEIFLSIHCRMNCQQPISFTSLYFYFIFFTILHVPMPLSSVFSSTPVSRFLFPPQYSQHRLLPLVFSLLKSFTWLTFNEFSYASFNSLYPLKLLFTFWQIFFH